MHLLVCSKNCKEAGFQNFKTEKEIDIENIWCFNIEQAENKQLSFKSKK